MYRYALRNVKTIKHVDLVESADYLFHHFISLAFTFMMCLSSGQCCIFSELNDMELGYPTLFGGYIENIICNLVCNMEEYSKPQFQFKLSIWCYGPFIHFKNSAFD